MFEAQGILPSDSSYKTFCNLVTGYRVMNVILQAAATYIDVYEKVTGREFALPDLSIPPLARVRANLSKYFDKAA